MQLGLEDELGPFRVRLDKVEYTSKDLIRGPTYDIKSSDTTGEAIFAYSYRRLFSLSGQYKLGELRTERATTGETYEETRDFSAGFRISPVPTITLSGTMLGRQEQSSGFTGDLTMDSLTNRIQLMLQPLRGILMNTTYSKNDISESEQRPVLNESLSVTLYVEPRQGLVFSGYVTAHDSSEDSQRLLSLRRSSFDLRAEPIEGINVISRIDSSESTNFVSDLRNSRNNVVTRLEAIPTANLRTEVSYDWQRSSRWSRGRTDDETQHTLAFDLNYSFIRMLDLNLRYSKNISTAWEGSTNSLTYGINYQRDGSNISIRYSKTESPEIDPLSLRRKLSATNIFTSEIRQEISRGNYLSLRYETRSDNRQFGPGKTTRISFQGNLRF